MHELELIYKSEIKPLVDRIALIAKQTNMPLFMTFQDGYDTFTSHCLNAHHSAFERLKLHTLVNQSWSIDDFIEVLVADATKNGHNSEFLSALGIPKKPNNQETE